MSFAKFVWMLQKKQLWLSNAEYLGDKWEAMPNRQQLNTIANRQSLSSSFEAALDETKKKIKALREQTFINCWTASMDESYALWHLFCPSSEGVAIQTTIERLVNSVSLPVLEVTYSPKIDINTIPDIYKLVTQKRPIFEYEHEVRIVLVHDFSNIDPRNPGKWLGTGIGWDPDQHLENIWVHPDATFWFMETVIETVRSLAPKLYNNGSPRVPYSNINTLPPT
jgi:hypothetical protein